MYLCFETDDKRSTFPEASLISVDENGFTVKSFIGTRPGNHMAFFRMDSFQGVCQNFQQAVNWVKRVPSRAKAPAAGLPDKPKF